MTHCREIALDDSVSGDCTRRLRVDVAVHTLIKSPLITAMLRVTKAGGIFIN